MVCCGTGGVGKTTTAATLAIEGARRGRDAVVVTIDPAKRLANTLGLEHLSNTPHEITATLWRGDDDPAVHGRLHALMLDTKTTFDQLVTQYADDDEQSQRILANRFYRNIAGALSGTQEYMAMEKLYELHDVGQVRPHRRRHATHAARARLPRRARRLTRLLDNRIFRLLMVPTRTTFRVASAAAHAFVRTVSRVVGTEVIDDVIAFFHAFEGMEAGFRDRANQVMTLLDAGDVVRARHLAAPRRSRGGGVLRGASGRKRHDSRGADREPRASALRARLTRSAPSTSVGARRRAGRCRGATRARYANLADLEEVAGRERRELAGLEERLGNAAVAHVPELDHDVFDFAALRAVARHLMD